MLRYYIFFTILLITTLRTSAQDHVVRGSVKDDTGEPLVGATIAELDPNDRIINGTIADFNGNYVLSMSDPNSRIQFSFIGFKTITQEVNGRSTINVKLEADENILTDVTVVGEQTRPSTITGLPESSRVGSVGKLDMSSLEGEALNDASDALQGQIAGLDIVSSGSPGGSANIVIRGLATIGDATPLIVLDGIPQPSYKDFDFSTADAEDLSALLSIPTHDSKDIRVLKDATESAVWGSRGANGVIEIFTNQGRKGKTKFSYVFKQTYNEIPQQIPMLSGDEYILLQQEMLFNRDGLVTYPDEIAFNPNYVDFYNYSQNTNWYDEVTQNGYVRENSFKVDGGGDKTLYYISLNLSSQKGNVINESLDKINTRVNLNYKISNKINLTTRFTYLNSLKGANWKSVEGMAYTKAPNMAVYEYNANGELTGDFFNPITNYQGNGVKYYNPVAVVNYSTNDTETNQLNSDFILSLKPHRYISFSQTISILNKGTKRNVFLPYNAIGAEWNDPNNNNAQELNSVNNALTTRALLKIDLPNFKDHKIISSFVFETNSSSSKNMRTTTQLNNSYSIDDPASGSIVGTVGSGSSKQTLIGMLASAAYNYRQKYYVTGLVRADASSRFGLNNRWGVFPSIGVKWMMAEEPFLKSAVPFINRSNLSLSWARAGNINNSVGAYSRHGIYTGGPSYFGSGSIIPSQIQLDNLKWETSEEVNSSLELGFFENNKFTLTLEYYNKRKYDLSWSNYGIPTTSGYATLDSYNGGAIRNVGYELSGNLNDVIKTKDFSVMLRFNINKNKNWFEEFPDNQKLISGGDQLTNMTYPNKIQVNKPFGSIFGVHYLGVYPTDEDAMAKYADGTIKVDAYGNPIPMVFTNGTAFKGGDAIYEDINYDGVIDLNDALYLGDSNPKLIGGFGSTARYKRLSLSINFFYRLNFDVINNVAMDSEGMNNKNNQSKATLYRWRKQGDDFEGMIPRAYYDHQFNSLGSDRYVEDGTFIKLNSLTLNYSVGKKGSRTLKLSDLRISLNMRTLHTWTNYSGQDPEITTSIQNPFWVGKDNGRTTPPRVFSLMVSASL
jgi:TonB-linked SusC/RagA family outer membrane protein